MTLSKEVLMAYADGEVDEATRAAVEQAMQSDPQVSKIVEAHRALRERLQKGFAADLAEPVPERLLAVLQTERDLASNVVNLHEAQAARVRLAQARSSNGLSPTAPSRAGAFWRAAPALAAGLVLGLVIAYGPWRTASLPIARDSHGLLVAKGELDSALTNQLTAAEDRRSAVRIRLSYVAKTGEYCRTFSLSQESAAGIACRQAGEWHVQALTQAHAAAADGYRPASSSLSPLILKAVEDEIQGEPLDASAESSARAHGWTPPK